MRYEIRDSLPLSSPVIKNIKIKRKQTRLFRVVLVFVCLVCRAVTRGYGSEGFHSQAGWKSCSAVLAVQETAQEQQKLVLSEWDCNLNVVSRGSVLLQDGCSSRTWALSSRSSLRSLTHLCRPVVSCVKLARISRWKMRSIAILKRHLESPFYKTMVKGAIQEEPLFQPPL